MTTNDQTDQPHESIYTYAGFIGIAAGWRYQSIAVGVMATITAAVGIYMYRGGYWVMLGEWLWPHIITTYKAILAYIRSKPIEEQENGLALYEVCVGKNTESREYLIPTLQELGSFGVFAITGGGKTSFIHSFIHQLILVATPKDLLFFISDLKEGLDFRIFKRLPHLLFPIASNTAETEQGIMGLLEEMSRRAELFKAIPEDRLCNNLDDYHRLGAGLGLPRLPRIVAIIDEFQNVTNDSETALNGLIKLAKEGRAFGISLVCATQLPNVDALPTALKSQFSSVFCGYLKNPSHYYKIVEVAKDYWEPFHQAGKITGRFMADIGGEVMTIQSIWIPKKELEHLAREWSIESQEPIWPEKYQPSFTPIHIWSGSYDDKRAMLIEWFQGFDHRPTFEEFQNKFNASRSTYFEYVPKVWDEIKVQSE
jgi:hypothetical protein